MKIMKNILFTITLLASASALAMEAPPTAPIKVTDARLLLPLKGLPADLQRKLFPLCMEGNLYEVAETILAFAGTNKENQSYINDNMVTILESLPYTAKAIDVYKLLEKKSVSLPVMQKLHMKIWLKNAQQRLCQGEELFDALCNPHSIEPTHELLKIKSLDLNRAHHGNDYTCLGYAVCTGQQEKVRLLLQAGANPNLADFNAPLMWAMYTRNHEIVSMLLQAGANPDLKNMKRKGQTARSIALEKGLHEIASLLDAVSLAKKQKLEERKKRLYGSKTESIQQNSAAGCAIA